MALPGHFAVAFTAAFNDPEHADVRLHLSTATVDQPPAKKPRKGAKARKGAPATAPCAPSHACSYSAHALVLSAHSAYFKARLGQDSSRFKPDDVGGAGGSDGASSSTPQIRFEIVEHINEADLEAMDMLLRTLYGAQVESVDAEVLLRALHLADRFLVSAPVAQLLASRLVQVPADAITAGIVQLAFSERSGTAVLMPKDGGDALLARFCSLSHAAVLDWASDGGLEVSSENDVVYLLSEWVEAQKSAGRPCSAEELKQLVHMVRLSDCGPAYLQSILPALDWFKSGRKSLSRFAMFRGLTDAGLEYNDTSSTPDAWTAGPRERLAKRDTVIEWHVSAEQLEDAAEKRLGVGAVFSNGFWMTAYLHRRASKTTPGEFMLGYFVKVDGDRMTKAVPWPEQAAVALSCWIELGKEATERSSVRDVITGAESWGCIDFLGALAASVAAAVAPHLEDGQLKGKVTFSNVDLLGRRRST
ncbi:hypothetical protein FOA52_000013 [Chlamydomonas sp. UWO 241]|nr:hypothetical protein FOA52_000013 [Chlamydomonas sp. UWO 241]